MRNDACAGRGAEMRLSASGRHRQRSTGTYSGYRFPPEIVRHAIWLYVRFTLSFRDLKICCWNAAFMVSWVAIRRWLNHFGPMIAGDLR
jgi:putative transposase